MSKRIKNIVAILVFLFLVLGAGLFFFYRWMMRLPRTEGELYDSFCVRMDKKYGDGGVCAGSVGQAEGRR